MSTRSGLLIETQKAARQLARVYHCNPMEFYDLTIDEVWHLYTATMRDLEEESASEH